MIACVPQRFFLMNVHDLIDDSIEELLRWCHEQNIEIDTRIVICKDENSTINVRALDAVIESNVQRK